MLWITLLIDLYASPKTPLSGLFVNKASSPKLKINPLKTES
jgi:hypothetical protein